MNASSDELTCRELVAIVTDYLEGTLPAPDVERFDRHLDECPYCRTYLQQMRQTIQLLGRITEEELAPQVRDVLLKEFRGWKAGE